MSLKRSLVPRARLVPVALALGLAGPLARAEDLMELYNAARAYDATYLSARAQADSVQYRTAQANALRLPSVGLAGNATRGESDAPGFPSTLSQNSVGATLSARQPLFNRANGATIAQAERDLEVARATLETAEQDLIVRVAQAYFDVLSAQDTLTLARASKTAITEQLASAKRNFEVGTATITDTREAQARFDLSTAQELAAENDLRTRRIVLDQLVGRANVQPNPLAGPVSLPAPQPASPDQWVTSADKAHPAIRRAALGHEIAQLETDKARAGHLPTVDLVGGYSSTRNTGELPALQGTRGTSRGASVGVQLNVPLFSGFAVQNRVRETVVLQDKAREDLETARRTVAQTTRTAYYGLQTGQARVQALEAAEASSKLALEATQLGYKVGVRVNLDVLNAQTQLFQTQTDLAKARYDLLMSSLRLEQAAGQLDPADLQRINQLVAKR
jgi:outer membrane protein